MASKFKVVDATEELCLGVAASMRPEEREEVWASHRETPEQAIVNAFHQSFWAKVGLAPDGTPLMALGLQRVDKKKSVAFGFGPADWTCVWALGSTEILKYKVGFLRESRRVTLELSLLYPNLGNFCDARYTKSLQWLKWLGFRIGNPLPYGKGGKLFCPVWIGGEVAPWARH